MHDVEMGGEVAIDKEGIREVYSFEEFQEMRQRVEELTLENRKINQVLKEL